MLESDVQEIVSRCREHSIAEAFAGKRALVSGARGFLGRHFVSALAAMGAKVTAVDSYAWGVDLRIEKPPQLPNVEYINADITLAPPSMIAGPKIDFILSLAGIASPVWYRKKPIETFDISVKGIRCMLDVALSQGSRVLFSSSSEVYGNPSVVPTPESYLGGLQLHGDRSCYDLGKAAAETLCHIYHSYWQVDTRIVRYFNSLLANEWVVFDDGSQARVMTTKNAHRVFGGLVAHPIPLQGVTATSYDFLQMASQAVPASHFTALPPTTAHRGVRITTARGRSLRLTADHKLFVRTDAGVVVEKPVCEVRPGDLIAVAGGINLPERARSVIDVAEALLSAGFSPWEVLVLDSDAACAAWACRNEVKGAIQAQRLLREGEYCAPQPTRLSGEVQSWRDGGYVPLWWLKRQGKSTPFAARVKYRHTGKVQTLPARIAVDDDLLWFLGFYTAEGSTTVYQAGACTVLSGDHVPLLRAKDYVTQRLGLVAAYVPPARNRAPALRIESTVLQHLLDYLGVTSRRGARGKRIPGWILSLPTTQLRWYLEGYREGDGTFKGKLKARSQHCFSTSSRGLAQDLIVALGRFNLVPTIGRYQTWVGKRATAEKKFWAFQVGLSGVSPWPCREWVAGRVKQALANGIRERDVVWLPVRAVRPAKLTRFIYDLSVPGLENFLTSSGIIVHNCYGPGLSKHDQRVLPMFVSRLLSGERLKVYGSGEQTRTFCYSTDAIVGSLLVLAKGAPGGVYNVGNDRPEISMRELAQRLGAVFHVLGVEEAAPPPEYAEEPRRRCPDLSRLKGLGFKNCVTLDEGLSRFLSWAREAYK